MVNVLDCQLRDPGSNPVQKFGLRFFRLHTLANSAKMSTLAVQCQWEDETVRERIGHPLSYAKGQKMKSLTLHTHAALGLT